LRAAEEGGRTGSVIEILTLQALAHRVQNDMPAALAPLERALTLAKPEGYVHMFVGEEAAMAALLEAAAEHRIALRYVRQLLAAGSWASPHSGPAQSQDSEDTQRSEPLNQALIEPLSERELDVLRLLKTDLNGPEIARALTVSLNTLHTDTKNIYTKLGVNNRRAAVRRAEELRLL
jgi:LuxR family maltose regulon positive regulatory protein